MRLLLLPLLVGLSRAFNLEPRLALLKEGPEPGRDYFGFSVAEHQILSHDPDRGHLREDPVVLVGAPLGGQGNGVLYSCPLTTATRDCQEVDPLPKKHRKQHLKHAKGQWLGSVVQSQGAGKQVIVCAHRYTKREGSEHRWAHGKCYTLNQNLKHAATWDPCEGREKNSAHEQWGYCQVGTSALLTEDNHALLGSPGPFTWRGTVFALSVDEDFLFRDKTHYHTPLSEGSAPVEKYAYLGMAVAAGNFLPRQDSCGQRLAYAAGAPRAGGTGKVLLFVKCGGGEILRVQKLLQGDNFASSFGYSLASVDVNGDGLQDLFVGAPFYHGKGRGGAVYVHMNDKQRGLRAADGALRALFGREESRFGFALTSAGDLNNDHFEDLVIGAPYDGRGRIFVHLGGAQGLQVEPSQVIGSEDLPFSKPIRTFGYSLSGGLDLDLNNHSDVVVGAFESSSVVVLRSRSVIDISTWFGKHPKRIQPGRAGGCDADLLSTEVCFTLESCFLIKNFPANLDHTFIRYKLEAEVFGSGGRRVSRIRFGDAASNASHVSEKTVEIQQHSLTGCFLETAYLKEGVRDLITPVAFRLTLQLEQDRPMERTSEWGRGHQLPNINQHPILNQHEARKQLTIPMQKDCGDDDVCTSELATAVTVSGLQDFDPDQLQLHLQDKMDVELVAEISNLAEPAYEARLRIALDPFFAYVGRNDWTDSTGGVQCDLTEDQLVLDCALGNPYPAGASTRLSFRLMPKVRTKQDRAIANFAWSTETSSNDLLGSSRNQSLRFDLVKKAEVSLASSVQPQEVFYEGGQGHILGESAMKVLSDIGAKVQHTFQVTNEGPWHVDQAQLVIPWPVQLAMAGWHEGRPGKWLLYLSDMPEVSPAQAGSCVLNPRLVNYLGLREGRKHEVGERSRRQAADPPLWPEAMAEGAASAVHHEVHWQPLASHRLHCGDMRTICRPITCTIHRLRANESVIVRVKSRLWNATLAEEFPSATGVQIDLGSRLVLSSGSDESVEVEVRASSPGGMAALVAVSNAPPASAVVPTWAILCAIAAGLLLVTVIIIVLYKFGFFRRQRLHQQQQQAHMQGQDELLISAKYSAAGSIHSGLHDRSRRLKDDQYIS